MTIKSLRNYKARGVLLGLLVAINIVPITLAIGNIPQIIGYNKIIDANPSDLSHAW